jgi:hypothetical protein
LTKHIAESLLLDAFGCPGQLEMSPSPAN